MNTTTLSQKLLLTLFGCLLLLALLEVGLRLGGFLLTVWQERYNRATFSANEVRVLCIGDSMTALGGLNSYPAQLQEILNREKLDHENFNVINEGIISATSTTVLSHLEQNLKKFKPDIVICMIGVNDHHALVQGGSWQRGLQVFFSWFRTYKLFQMIGLHLQKKMSDVSLKPDDLEAKLRRALTTQESDVEFFQQSLDFIKLMDRKLAQLRVRLEQETKPEKRQQVESLMMNIKEAEVVRLLATGHEFRIRGDYNKAARFLQVAMEEAPKNFLIYVEMARCFKDQKMYREAAGILTRAIELSPNTIIAEMELASCYEALGFQKKAEKIYEDIFERHTQKVIVNPDIGDMLLKNKSYSRAEMVILSAIHDNPTDYNLYENLALLYEHRGKNEQADLNYRKAREIKQHVNQALTVTVNNYNEIANLVRRYQAKFVVMQYPLREIKYLNSVFSAGQVDAFVENHNNFIEALKGALWGEYFTDSFGGDFGHCTRKGNRLIAQNAAVAIRSLDILHVP